MTCAALILGLHLATAHVRTDLENVNPGAYVQCDNVQAGAYRNSIGRTTVYAGYVVQAGPVDVLIGAATGYRQTLRPVFVPSVALPAGFRLSFLFPSGGGSRGGVHLAWERAL